MLDVVTAHISGPDLYLKCYKHLLYLVAGHAKIALDNFFAHEPIPFLHEFEQKIKGYDELRQEICIFRNKVKKNTLIQTTNLYFNDNISSTFFPIFMRFIFRSL